MTIACTSQDLTATSQLRAWTGELQTLATTWANSVAAQMPAPPKTAPQMIKNDAMTECIGPRVAMWIVHAARRDGPLASR
jgi:hypothetical protein